MFAMFMPFLELQSKSIEKESKAVLVHSKKKCACCKDHDIIRNAYVRIANQYFCIDCEDVVSCKCGQSKCSKHSCNCKRTICKFCNVLYYNSPHYVKEYLQWKESCPTEYCTPYIYQDQTVQKNKKGFELVKSGQLVDIRYKFF